jgi:hypothetical protein
MTAPQSEAKATPGPWGCWRSYTGEENTFEVGPGPFDTIAHVRLGHADVPGGCEANALLLSASWDLLEAAQLLENAEAARCGCDECEDEGEPECCSKCFPLFDDARVKRRLAIAKALGAQI